MRSNKFDDFLKEQLNDAEISKEYYSLQPEREIIKAIVEARNSKGLTQKELSSISGIAQGDISKIETGTANPSIRTLQRLATAMGMVLKLELTPVGSMDVK